MSNVNDLKLTPSIDKVVGYRGYLSNRYRFNKAFNVIGGAIDNKDSGMFYCPYIPLQYSSAKFI